MDGLVVQVRGHRVEEEPGRRLVGVADAEVDDVLPLLLEDGAFALELREEIGRKFLQAVAGRKGHRFTPSSYGLAESSESPGISGIRLALGVLDAAAGATEAVLLALL